MLRRVIISISILALATCALPASAQQRSPFDRATFLYGVMDLHVGMFRQCATLRPSDKAKYNALIERYRRDTKPLTDKVRQVIIARGRTENPAAVDKDVVAVIEKWSAAQTKKNIDFQMGRREQLEEKCDYIANPENRKYQRLPVAWRATLLGLPGDEHPEDVQIINAWKP